MHIVRKSTCAEPDRDALAVIAEKLKSRAAVDIRGRRLSNTESAELKAFNFEIARALGLPISQVYGQPAIVLDRERLQKNPAAWGTWTGIGMYEYNVQDVLDQVIADRDDFLYNVSPVPLVVANDQVQVLEPEHDVPPENKKQGFIAMVLSEPAAAVSVTAARALLTIALEHLAKP